MSQHAATVLVIAPATAQERLLDLLRPLCVRLTLAHDIIEARQALERSVVLATFFVAPGQAYERYHWPETLRFLAERCRRLHMVVTTLITGEWVLPIVLRRQSTLEPRLTTRESSERLLQKNSVSECQVLSDS